MDPPNVDMGVISFVTVLVSSTYLLALANVSSSSRVPPPVGPLTRTLATSSQVLVALNYLLGAYLGFTVLERPGFGSYCVIFVGLWLGIAYTGNVVMKSPSLTATAPVEADSLL
jgi:hypothetical protein